MSSFEYVGVNLIVVILVISTRHASVLTTNIYDTQLEPKFQVSLNIFYLLFKNNLKALLHLSSVLTYITLLLTKKTRLLRKVAR